MTLYTPEEAQMFAQFAEIMYDKRMGDHERAFTAKQTGPAPEVVEQELEKESEQAYSEGPISGAQLVGDSVRNDAPATNVATAIERFKAYAQEKGLPAARAVLDNLGVKRAGDITDAQVPALLEAIK